MFKSQHHALDLVKLYQSLSIKASEIYIVFRLTLTFLFMRVKSFTLGQRAHGGERGAVSAGRGAVSAGRGVAGRGDTPLLGTRGGAPRG